MNSKPMDLEKALFIVCANAKFNPEKRPETMEAVRFIKEWQKKDNSKLCDCGRELELRCPNCD